MPLQIRRSRAGVHLFDRHSGLNVLADEVQVAADDYSQAPRYLSVALTNACDLHCAYCYAPKQTAMLSADRVVAWAAELAGAGCLGIGFGGGEPTTHPRFAQICEQVSRSTAMAVTFTTHGHRLTPRLVESLQGHVHFGRLSVDGVGDTYERLRGRPFGAVRTAAMRLRSLAPIGINTVVNASTIGELDDIAEFASGVGAVELLLLPQQATATEPGISASDAERLVRWIQFADPPIRLAISRTGVESSVVTAEPIPGEDPLEAHLHVDATGKLRPHAYARTGVAVTGSVLAAAHELRQAI
jgi:sulfatase maturation enzyme AslB (radical SAM superfamily)